MRAWDDEEVVWNISPATRLTIGLDEAEALGLSISQANLQPLSKATEPSTALHSVCQGVHEQLLGGAWRWHCWLRGEIPGVIRVSNFSLATLGTRASPRTEGSSFLSGAHESVGDIFLLSQLLREHHLHRVSRGLIQRTGQHISSRAKN